MSAAQILLETQGGGRLAGRNADGTYAIVLLTEGKGTSGTYPPELMNEHSASVFENVPTHPNHPVDKTKPEDRSPIGMIGRVTNVSVGTDKGKAALLGKFRPGNEDVAKYVEEFGDLLGFSIYCLAKSTRPDMLASAAFGGGMLGRGAAGPSQIVEEFDADFPYRSVDLVLAAGRGGRFQLAQESLLAIESAIGTPEVSPKASYLEQLLGIQPAQARMVQESSRSEAVVDPLARYLRIPGRSTLIQEDDRSQGADQHEYTIPALRGGAR